MLQVCAKHAAGEESISIISPAGCRHLETQERQAAAASAGGRLSAGTIQLGVGYAPVMLGLSSIKHLRPLYKLHA